MFGPHDRFPLLKNGSVAHLRDMRPSDASRVHDGFMRMSEESRYARFLYSMSEATGEQLEYFTRVDGTNHVAVIALSSDEDRGLGAARLIRDPSDPTSAEFAITIVDDAQGLGLGTALLDLLMDEAREVGIERVTAQIHNTNWKIRRLMRKVNAECVGGEGSVSFYEWRL
jgi:RimJ/RimL family protein N-acetyltransferase